MLFPVDIRSVGIVTPFGINNHEAVSRVFEQSALCDYAANDAFEKIRIRDYLSSHQKDMPAIRYMDVVSKKAIIAARGSLLGAGIADDDIHKEAYRFGVVMATSKGPSATRRKLFNTLSARNQQSVSATLFSNCGYNIATSLVAGFMGMRGANFTMAGDDHVAQAIFARSSVLLEKGCIDYALVGYADSDLSKRPDASRICMSDFSCVFCITKADRHHPIARSLRLEAVDAIVVEKEYDWEDTPEIGGVYGARTDTGKKNNAISLKRLNLPVNTAVREDCCYLPFLHLALLWQSEQFRSDWKFWLLPLNTYSGVTYMKASPF